MASEFGKRLAKARDAAGLTQTELGQAVGLSQSTIASAESEGAGSRKTPQLAAACKVNAHWLATGEDQENWDNPGAAPKRSEGQDIAQTLRSLAAHLASADQLTRQAVEPFVRRIVLHPEEAYEISNRVLVLVAAEPQPPSYLARQPVVAGPAIDFDTFDTATYDVRSTSAAHRKSAYAEIARVTNSGRTHGDPEQAGSAQITVKNKGVTKTRRQ